MNLLYKTYSPLKTENIAYEFADNLKAGDIIRLHGDIGAGKTVFVRGLAKKLASCDDVCSPTFSIMNIYQGEIPIYHFDLYRLEDEEEIYEAGLVEYINGNGISVIEWPERLTDYAADNIYDVYINKNLDINDDYREIEIKFTGGGELENSRG